MTHTAVTADGLEPLQVLLQFPAQIAFNNILVLLDNLNDAVQLLVGEHLGAQIVADLRLIQNLFGPGRPNSVNVRKRCDNSFVTRNIDTKKARHKFVGTACRLTLALFEPGIFLVNDVNATLASDYLAIRCAAFNRGAYFHRVI
jgi:hypothetical protein